MRAGMARISMTIRHGFWFRGAVRARQSIAGPLVEMDGCGDGGRRGMARIVDWVEMGGWSATRFVFRGDGFGSSVCVFVTDFPPGEGPVLHRHPYDETFVVHEGIATFTAGDETVEATVGQVVVVPAGTPHRYENRTRTRLRVMSVHPRPSVDQENIDG